VALAECRRLRERRPRMIPIDTFIPVPASKVTDEYAHDNEWVAPGVTAWRIAVAVGVVLLGAATLLAVFGIAVIS
jgi:hypothetical protein